MLIGRPNAGKSSLLNALAGYDRAIVTDIPGTTRDTLEVEVELGGVPVRLIDTAGLRQSDDPIERMGVERSRRAMEEAELILVLWDSSVAPTQEDGELLEQALSLAPTILIHTKTDLPSGPMPFLTLDPLPPVVELSTKTGEGLEALEQAAGLRPGRDRLDAFLTQGTRWEPRAVPVVSFSGGVADCIYAPPGDWKAYGDIGVLLGRAIAASPAFQGAGRFRGEETIRATVVGAGSHSTELSGSTIYYRDIAFPLKNLPILKLTGEEERGDAAALAQCIRDKLGWFADEGGLSPLALALRGEGNPSYARVDELARGIAGGLEPLLAQGIAPVVLVEADQAKVLGQAMAQRVEGPLLCLDSVGVDNGDYIDIGAPVAGGAVLPVVIKTLVFNKS